MKKTSRIDRMIQELKALIEKARLAAKARVQKRRSPRVMRKPYIPQFLYRRPSPSPRRFPSSRTVAHRRYSSPRQLVAGTAVAIAPYIPSNQAPSATVRRSPKAKRSLFSISENNSFTSPPATLSGASPRYVPAGGPPSTPRK